MLHDDLELSALGGVKKAVAIAVAVAPSIWANVHHCHL